MSKFSQTFPGDGRWEGNEPQWRLIEAPAHAEEPGIWPSAYIVGTIANMAGKIPSHIAGLFKYLSAPHEKANEDLALGFFRHEFGEAFTRQKEAKFSDGYVSGHFLLELKGARSDWFKGLLQGALYHRDLDFGSVVVIAKGFLGVWRVDAMPEGVMAVVHATKGAASAGAEDLAKEWKHRKEDFLRSASYLMKEEMLVDGGLFQRADMVVDAVTEFLTVLRTGKRVRLKLTPANFTKVLRGMVPFFSEPLKAVRAFYSMVYAWDVGSRVVLSERNDEHATIAGEVIEHLLPEKRDGFKEYVERYAVQLGDGETPDAFFARYDEALDTVDPDFRRVNGIFFTDMDLSRFVVWLVKQHLGDVGKNYLVIDPACGSGNLVTNWRAPMELRHKVVSEIEPELLFAVERRMKGDRWHEGRFTVIPKVKEGKGLNFLNRKASSYLDTLRKYLAEKGQNANRPIAFLCNPPFRNDKDRKTADPITYKLDEAIVDLIGAEASNDRYCSFLAQMKLVCDAAEASNLPGDSLLLVFTKVGWLTDRGVLRDVRRSLLKDLDFVAGIMVNGKQFFDVKGEYPIAFTVWRHCPGINTQETALVDLTHLKKPDLATIPWNDNAATDARCRELLASGAPVTFGVPRMSMREWTGATMQFFLRERRKSEPQGDAHTGGLPLGDSRVRNKKAYGEVDGPFVGFMDDLTPCRVRRGLSGVPWFRLDSPMMDVRKGRCLSGPPDQKGFAADPTSTAASDRIFIWYAVQKVFAEVGYPMWSDPFDVWAPRIPVELEAEVRRITRAIAYADNECVETRFPPRNPSIGSPEIFVPNPMSPNDPDSFWNRRCASIFGRKPSTIADRLVSSVDNLFACWRVLFRRSPELTFDVARPYYLGASGFITASSGVIQIKDYVDRKDNPELREAFQTMRGLLKEAKGEFHRMLLAKDGIDYFGASAAQQTAPPPVPPAAPSKPGIATVAKQAGRAKRASR